MQACVCVCVSQYDNENNARTLGNQISKIKFK